MTGRDRPLIEVIGPWLNNSGDVLNLWSVADRLSTKADLAASSTLGLDELPAEPALLQARWRLDRTAAGLAVRSRSIRQMVGFFLDTAALVLPGDSQAARSRGLAAAHRLTALLDCSGYAYGDTWHVNRVYRRIRYYGELSRNGTRIVMLPQAFGPFQDPVKRDATIRLLNFCHTIYARDEISLEHLRELKLAADIQGPTPDITHLLAGREPEDPTEWARRVCVVPNARMLDRTSSDTAQRYTAFMQRVLQIVRDKALEPVLVVHETFDLPLAQHLATADAAGVRILHKDAITTKGLLGASYAVIGSRYHALVSALSQVTPSLATSWSHKYGELFRDYGCPENILSMDSDLPTLEAQASAFLEPDRRNQLRERLTARASHHRQRVEEMWQRVETILWQEASARRR